MQNDIEYLTKLWRDLTGKSGTMPAPSLVYQDLNLAQRVLRDMVTEETTRIQVDSRETFQKMQEFSGQYTQNISDRIAHYVGERPLFDLNGVEEEIEKALGRRVDLKSGGYLIFDQTEAMTTIDVNTGGFVGGRSFDETIFKTNLEAAQVIARQLRLRNLGGIIIIDFIDMSNEGHQNAVLAEPQLADGTASPNWGWSRDARSAARSPRTCAEPHTRGRGEIKTADDLLRDPARDRPRVSSSMRANSHLASCRSSIFLDEEPQASPSSVLHRQADFAAGRVDRHAGTIRHCLDLAD
jgi:ribonuclease G